jgi:hypothetical protein
VVVGVRVREVHELHIVIVIVLGPVCDVHD